MARVANSTGACRLRQDERPTGRGRADDDLRCANMRCHYCSPRREVFGDFVARRRGNASVIGHSAPERRKRREAKRCGQGNVATIVFAAAVMVNPRYRDVAAA
jgi:hypothetical protein